MTGGLRDPAELDETELVRFRLMIFIAVEGAQASFLVKDHSETARRHFEALDSLFIRTMGTPGGRAWLDMFSSTLHPDFVSHMDKVLASSPIISIVTKED